MVVLLWTTYVLGPYIMAESYVSELVKLCRSLHQFTTLKREYLILYEVASSIIVRKYSTFEVNHSDMLNIYLLLENEYNISGRVTPPLLLHCVFCFLPYWQLFPRSWSTNIEAGFTENLFAFLKCRFCHVDHDHLAKVM